MSTLIYVVDDEENIRELISCALRSFGYAVESFETAEEMLEACLEKLPDLILLDVMLPGLSGTDALKKLKAIPSTAAVPVILITAKSAETDKVFGLDSGADDYITKPFGVLELSARVRAALRRKDRPALGPLVHGGLCLDVEKHEVTKEGERVELTLKEFQLLKLLLENEGRVVPREELLGRVWGFDFEGESRTLDMHIKTLRKKLSDSAEHPTYITTVRGVGYLIK